MRKDAATWIYIELAPVTKISHNRAVARMLRAYLNTDDISKFPKLEYIHGESGASIIDRLEAHLDQIDNMLIDKAINNGHEK